MGRSTMLLHSKTSPGQMRPSPSPAAAHRTAKTRIVPRPAARFGTQAIISDDSCLPQWQTVAFWGRRNGVCCDKLQLWDFNGLRGMRAQQEIANGETIITLPYSSTIHIHPFQAAPSAFQSQLDAWSKCSWDVQLALSLLFNKVQGKFATYVNQLPAKVNLPLTWSQAHVEQLQNPWAVKEVEQQRTKLQKATASAAPLLHCLGASEEEFAWAYCLVQSRSYGGPYFVTKTPHKLIIVALLEVWTVFLSKSHVMESFDASLLGMSILLVLLAAELILAQSLQQHTLCPVIDLLNHDSNSKSYCTLDFFTNQFKVVADRSYQRGEQVTMSYGQLSNDTLLLRYGFVEPNNPHDHYVMSSLPSTLKAFGLQLTKPQEERLATVRITREGPSDTVLEWVAQAVNATESTSPLGQLLPYSKQTWSTAQTLVAAACRAELEGAGTSLQQDLDSLDMCTTAEERVILQYRTEKKKILMSALDKLEPSRV